jgi:hypothetical protein
MFPKKLGFMEPEKPQQGDREETGVVVYLKFDYKVILLIAIIFDFLHISLREFVAQLFFG